MTASLLHTPLTAWHQSLGAKLVPFAGYAMPVQYPSGILAEHRHTRQSASLFDVSHMGQISLSGAGAAAALETLVPQDIVGLPVGKQRYAFFTDPSGGLLDDLMVTRREDDLLLVVNAACKEQDLAHLTKHLSKLCKIESLPERALIALQGPMAAKVLERLNPAISAMTFMTGASLTLGKVPCFVTRSGYTGEDGFEISCEGGLAEDLTRSLMTHPEVAPAGLGARDTLRLEAGLCLYGHDIDASTSPVEAGLQWAMQKVRRPSGERAGGYPGADIIAKQLLEGPKRQRVGLVGSERTPVRKGAELVDAEGTPMGRVTSGTLAPTVDKVIAMGMVNASSSAIGTAVFAMVRGKALPMTITSTPFTPHRYQRAPKV